MLSSTEVSTLTPRSNSIHDIGKLSPKLFWFTTGMLFFSMVAYIAFFLQIDGCNNSIITTVFGESEISVGSCVAIYLVGSIISSTSIGLMVSVAETRWELHSNSNTDKKDINLSTESSGTITVGQNLI